MKLNEHEEIISGEIVWPEDLTVGFEGEGSLDLTVILTTIFLNDLHLIAQILEAWNPSSTRSRRLLFIH